MSPALTENTGNGLPFARSEPRHLDLKEPATPKVVEIFDRNAWHKVESYRERLSSYRGSPKRAQGGCAAINGGRLHPPVGQQFLEDPAVGSIVVHDQHRQFP